MKNTGFVDLKMIYDWVDGKITRYAFESHYACMITRIILFNSQFYTDRNVETDSIIKQNFKQLCILNYSLGRFWVKLGLKRFIILFLYISDSTKHDTC